MEFVLSNMSIALFSLILISEAICEVTIQNVFTKTDNIKLSNMIHTDQAVSKVTCSSLCDQTVNCKSVNYNTMTGECQLSREPLIAAGVLGETSANWVNYAKDEWMLAFRATAGAGGDLYYAWTNGVNVTTDDVTCMTADVTNCTKQYRSAIIDQWTSSRITKVKLALYKNNVEVAYIVFNGTDSSSTSWFRKEAIIDSSYTAIKTDSFNYFSIFGHGPGRRFFINRSYNSCPGDTTYLVVVINGAFSCNFDSQPSYPQFIYSTPPSFGYPNSMTGMELADLMAIYIK